MVRDNPRLRIPPLDESSGLVGLKYDQGKDDWSLLPMNAIREVVKVFTYGSQKYSKNNWRFVADTERYVSAFFRHIEAWRRGEVYDPESGLRHLSHACCNLVILVWFEITGKT
jgi:hypothetical protein